MDFNDFPLDKARIFAAAALGVTALLISWFNPLAALFTAVTFGLMYLISSVVSMHKDYGAGQAGSPLPTERNLKEKV